jgi:N-acetylglucosaminyldiphosphoundecaprenol N-acetyl-beta-D-mannosaminyltransferase
MMPDPGHAPQRLEVLGAPVDAVDMRGAVAFVDDALRSGGRARSILAVNPEKVVALSQDRWLLDFFRGGALLIPDGIGVVWAARMLRRASLARVPGADLMQELCALAAKRGDPVFLFGAKEEVSAAAAAKLKATFPSLRIAGRANGYVPGEAIPELVEEINRSGAKILFVALGSPKQERWIAEHGPKLRVNLIQGVGGTFDTIAGHVKRAPRAWQRLNLEWLYRLLDDPRRVRRQAVLPGFAWRVLLETLRQRGSTVGASPVAQQHATAADASPRRRPR